MPNAPVYRSSREDGRFLSTNGFLHAHLTNLRPKLAFDKSMGRANFSAWRSEVRAKVRELMLFPKGMEGQPAPKHVWTEPRDGYELQKWEAYPEPFCVVPFLVLVPEGASEASPAPAAMCFPGSTNSKEGLAGEPELPGMPPPRPHWDENRMAQLYAQRGLVTVCVDNPGVRELGDSIRPERHELSVHAIWAGRHYEGISVFQKLCILDWLREQPFVDSDRIAFSGHSLGAKPALLMAVLDATIRAVVWNDFCSNWRERAIATSLEPIAIHQYVPGFLAWFDYTDLMIALAPRALLISEGGRTEDLMRIREAYRLLGAEEQFRFAYYPKYADPDSRPYDDVPLAEGLTPGEYLEYANVDVPSHCFKGKVAAPWLVEKLSE